MSGFSREISIVSWGAVSAAGWGVQALVAALRDDAILETEVLPGPGRPSCGVRRVPKPLAENAFFRHPRLRRASAITRFALAASLEALGEERLQRVRAGEERLGVIFVCMNGCVSYSDRFYGEVLRDPLLASPILFPETVFNAPASHLAAYLGCSGHVMTFVGDSGQFLPALSLGIGWLESGAVDACLVVGAEEANWLSAEGLRLFSEKGVASEGAGALLLERGSAGPVMIERLTPSFRIGEGVSRMASARQVREDLEALNDSDDEVLLVDGRIGCPRLDAPENEAWGDWAGPLVSPSVRLGHSMGACLALQCVSAAAFLADVRATRAFVSHTGGNQQSVGASFAQS